MENVLGWSEAKRIKRIAESMYKPGVMLEATFVNCQDTQDRKIIYYVNPKDIPVSFTIKYSAMLLFSVHKHKP